MTEEIVDGVYERELAEIQGVLIAFGVQPPEQLFGSSNKKMGEAGEKGTKRRKVEETK